MADTHRTIYRKENGRPVVESESEVVRARAGETKKTLFSRVWAAYGHLPGVRVSVVDKGANLHAVVEWRPEGGDDGKVGTVDIVDGTADAVGGL